jgi:hypothetical protein
LSVLHETCTRPTVLHAMNQDYWEYSLGFLAGVA